MVAAAKERKSSGAVEGVIQTRTCKVWLGEDGIVHVVVSPVSDRSLPDAVEDFQAITKVSLGKRRPVFADLREIKSTSKESRSYYSGDEITNNITAAALLISSPFSRLIGSFFLGINKPAVTTRIFTSKAEALVWLSQFMQ